MNMKRLSFVAALALGGLLAFTAATSAQDNNAPKRPGRRAPSVQQRVDRINTEVNLTDEQKTKVTSLFEKDAKQMQELRQNASNLSQDERREKFRALREESDKQLKAILKPEQWDKWQKAREQMGGPGARKGERVGGKKAE